MLSICLLLQQTSESNIKLLNEVLVGFFSFLRVTESLFLKVDIPTKFFKCIFGLLSTPRWVPFSSIICNIRQTDDIFKTGQLTPKQF